MKKFIFTLFFTIIIFSGFSVSGNDKKILENNLKNKITSNINNKIQSITNGITDIISNYNNVEYLEINTEFNDNEKASLSLLNVNKISEHNNLFLFNQNSLSLHGDNQTINFGLGVRNLIHDDRIILAAC